MIVIESTYWPLVVVGPVNEATVRPTDAVTIHEDELCSADGLLMALVVPGQGDRALMANDEIVDWIRRRHALVSQRVWRLAWIIEDSTIRGCTEAWLALTASTFIGQSATFPSVRLAMAWLLNTSPSAFGSVVADRYEAEDSARVEFVYPRRAAAR